VTRSAVLVGRRGELAQLRDALDTAAAGHGGLVLLAGEAGVGKTRLATEAVSVDDVEVLAGEASQGTEPFGPIVAALRSYLRSEPHGLDECSALLAHLALLLPELGRPARRPDRSLVLEAVGRAFVAAGRRRPAAVLLDDLQWADETTLADVLPVLARTLARERVLVLGAYRSDEVPRGHPIRRLRRDLRRCGRLRELALGPLDKAATTELVADVLGDMPSPALASLVFERTQGSPFFVEELVDALVSGRRLQPSPRGPRTPPGTRASGWRCGTRSGRDGSTSSRTSRTSRAIAAS
jgi:predicted ATPase